MAPYTFPDDLPGDNGGGGTTGSTAVPWTLAGTVLDAGVYVLTLALDVTVAGAGTVTGALRYAGSDGQQTANVLSRSLGVTGASMAELIVNLMAGSVVEFSSSLSAGATGTYTVVPRVRSAALSRLSARSFELYDGADTSKRLRFDLSNVPPGTTRTVSPPSGSGPLALLSEVGGGPGGVADGDKGDIVVTGSGATWTLDAAVATAAGRALMGAADAAAQRAALGAAAAVHGHGQGDIAGLAADLAGKAAATHAHAQADVTGLVTALAGKAASAHAHAPADLGSGTPSAANFLRGDGTWNAPAGGSDPWTVVKLASDFVTGSATAVAVTGMEFAPVASKTYLVEVYMFLRTATATVGPRPGCAWPTGLTDGVAFLQTTSAAGTIVMQNGNMAAAVLGPVGGLPTTTGSWPAFMSVQMIVGASPGGTWKLQLASETAATNVTMKAGSFLCYRQV